MEKGAPPFFSTWILYQSSRTGLVFEKAAAQYKMPAGMFFFGFALVTGIGGVRKDVPRGLAMLNDAFGPCAHCFAC